MEYCICYRRSDELRHHGIKGMKWGVRRYQNKDGTLTPAGRKRQAKREYDADIKAAKAKYKSARQDADGSDPERTARIAKKVAAAAIMTATVAAAAYVYSKNPQAVNAVVSKVGKTTVSALKKGGSKAVEIGKKYMAEAVTGVKEGVAAGVKNGPRKLAEAVVVGAVMNAGKRALDAYAGREEAARIFQANNGKKISSFWKVGQEDKDDEE